MTNPPLEGCGWIEDAQSVSHGPIFTPKAVCWMVLKAVAWSDKPAAFDARFMLLTAHLLRTEA
ncbi:MAG TPA: hypothetical protein D7I13_03845 [Candidatus Poseidoniales archaeon]|nr:MAG TPA: hypothetical protein D7I13_03845 [Candidatus Poseidoniales archaeon]